MITAPELFRRVFIIACIVLGVGCKEIHQQYEVTIWFIDGTTGTGKIDMEGDAEPQLGFKNGDCLCIQQIFFVYDILACHVKCYHLTKMDTLTTRK